MAEKKHISVSFPSIPFFYSTDPELAWKKTPNDGITLNLPFENYYHLLSNKPLFQPPPRPRIDSKNLDEPMDPKPEPQ